MTEGGDLSSIDGLDAPDTEYVSTPAGRFHRSCVRPVADGEIVDVDGSIVRDGKVRVRVRGTVVGGKRSFRRGAITEALDGE